MASLCVLLALAGCKKAEEAPEPVVAVEAEHPTAGPISEQIMADAILAPLTQAAISPRVSAPIAKEFVQRGSRVRKGELLLTLEARDLRGAALDSRGALAQAEAAYTAATLAAIPEDVQKAELDLAQAKANLEVANRTVMERQRLLTDGAIARREVDASLAAAVQAQSIYDAAKKHLENMRKTTATTNTKAAHGQLASAQGKLEIAEAQVSYASLRSPIDGVVTDRPLFPGEIANAGSSVVTVMDTSSLLAKVHVAQSESQKLKVGDQAELAIPGVDAPQTAHIALISPALDPGSTTVEVWLKIQNPAGSFKVGTPVHCVLHGITIRNAVRVPTAAILPGNDGTTNVLVVGADGRAHKHMVKIGMRTPESVQIVSGVSTEDLVIIQGGYGIDEGTKIKVGSGDEKSRRELDAPLKRSNG